MVDPNVAQNGGSLPTPNSGQCKYCGQRHSRTSCKEDNFRTCYFYRTRAFEFDYDNKLAGIDVDPKPEPEKPPEIALVVARRSNGKLAVKKILVEKARRIEIGRDTVKIVFDKRAVDFQHEG